ncbi:sugar ABC transporter substrate-binding protein [Branchiibius cervicis]|uniref:Sugar ABC transporter substrate-binding protein n=1 Tax=Branchiibius cervicis TaxID=908252 RepID=A0ABW2ASY3_9MICO
MTHRPLRLPARRLIGLAGIVAVTGVLLAGCGDDGSTGAASSAAGGGKTVNLWVMKGTNPDSSGYYNALKSAFKAKTGATVNITEVEWADAHDKLVRSFASGDGPDVSEIGATWNSEFAAAGGLADLSGRIQSSGLGSDELQALKDSATYDGKQYGVGWYAGTRGIVYRKDIFAKDGIKVPTNWAELEATVKTLKAKEPGMAAMPIAGASQYAAAPFIWGAGGDFATESGGTWTGHLDSARSRAGLSFYTGLATKDGSSTTGAATWKETDLLDAFTKGKAAMVIQGNWTPKAAVQADPSLKDKIGAFAIPGKDGGIAPTLVGGSNLAAMARSKNQDLDWQLIELMTTGSLAKQFAEESSFFPSTKSGLKSFANNADSLTAPFATAMLEEGRALPSAPQWGAAEGKKLIPQMLQSILTGTSVDEATSTANQQLTATLNES